ncbi:hypothetical protein NUW58_g5752 [Xylaria curta]|uniref:Uncharacterized protein n=1 Tax=Xylaria curta TaxID=42375 RepID=A0ACC1P1C4_9PEZI|nr:hypothetical protein NUW58_g5752 [Xylaria curta]
MTTPSRIITVTGSTGQRGGAVRVCPILRDHAAYTQSGLERLVRHGGFSIRAVTRNASSASAQRLARLPNVKVFAADYNDPDSLVPAFQGAEVVFGMTNFFDSVAVNGGFGEVTQACDMANIAKKTGVKLFIWSTSPSGIISSGGKIRGPSIVENKFMASVYLSTLGIPYLDLYVATYLQNWIRIKQFRRDADGTLVFEQPVMKPDTKIGMVDLDRDLGLAVIKVLETYREKPEILKDPLWCVGGQWCVNDLVAEVKKQTGQDVHVVTTATTGSDQLDQMYEYYNEWGVFRALELPHPKNKELGLELGTLENFVRQEVVPHLQAL